MPQRRRKEKKTGCGKHKICCEAHSTCSGRAHINDKYKGTSYQYPRAQPVSSIRHSRELDIPYKLNDCQKSSHNQKQNSKQIFHIIKIIGTTKIRNVAISASAGMATFVTFFFFLKLFLFF
jgi:hypothetical protein